MEEASSLKITKDMKEALRLLKGKGILQKEVCKEITLTSSHLSKVISGERPLTRQNFDLFNEKYGHIVMLDVSLIYPLPKYRELVATVYDLKQTAQDLAAIQQGLKEFVARRVAAKDKISHTEALAEMGILEEELLRKARSAGIPNG